MKKIILSIASLFLITMVSCGPAAEDREQMHIRAKQFQDSIARTLRNSMAEAEAPGPQVQAAPAADTTKTPAKK